MKRLMTLASITLLLFSCDRVKEKTKETINQGGEVVGKTATEFIEGVSEGVDKTLQCELIISQALKDKGIRTGKYEISNDTLGGENNRLILYIIFDKDFKEAVSVKAYDKKGMEIGRTKVHVEGKAEQAKYYDFVFDKRTYIEVKSKLQLE